jgi:phosphate transport system substrate-binding protein
MMNRRITRAALLGLLLAVLLGAFAPGCGDDKEQPDPQQAEAAPPPIDPRLIGLQFTDDELPRLDSSTSARPLIIWIASHLTGRECLWSPIAQMLMDPVQQDFPAALRPLVTAEMFAEASEGQNPFMAMNELTDGEFLGSLALHGTHGSYVQLIEGNADVIVVARGPSGDELALAEEKDVRLDVRPVALDAFVFLRHTDNAVTDLTAEQIREIYRGNITNWSEVGGPDQEIVPFTRERNSGSQETMVSLVMGGEPTIEGASMEMMTMMGPYSALAGTPTGIGYTFYYYNAFILPTENVEMFAVDGVAPNSETIGGGLYPFVTEVFAVTLKSLDPDSNAALLRDWLLTPEGQAVVAKSGYVPLP